LVVAEKAEEASVVAAKAAAAWAAPEQLA